MFRIIREEELALYKPQYKKLCRKFLDDSRRGQRKFKGAIRGMENAAKGLNGMTLWAITDRGVPKGYAVTCLTYDDEREPTLVVLQWHNLTIRDHLPVLEDFAVQAGVKKVLFQTLRSRCAVHRLLGPDWKMGPTIFVKRFKHG